MYGGSVRVGGGWIEAEWEKDASVRSINQDQSVLGIANMLLMKKDSEYEISNDWRMGRGQKTAELTEVDAQKEERGEGGRI